MELIWKETAIKSIKNIHSFYKKLFDDLDKVNSITEKIVIDIDLLKTSPKMGKKLLKNPLARQVILGKYRVLYHYDCNETVYILGIFNTAFQGYEKWLNKIDIP